MIFIAVPHTCLLTTSSPPLPLLLLLLPLFHFHLGGKKSLDGYGRKKYVSKLLFIFLLGNDLEFGHLEAVNLLSAAKFSEKQIVSVMFSFSSSLFSSSPHSLFNAATTRLPNGAIDTRTHAHTRTHMHTHTRITRVHSCPTRLFKGLVSTSDYSIYQHLLSSPSSHPRSLPSSMSNTKGLLVCVSGHFGQPRHGQHDCGSSWQRLTFDQRIARLPGVELHRTWNA